MNKLEARFAERLRLMQRSGQIARWDLQPEKLRLADCTYYEPDFRVINNDGEVVFYETKGFMRRAQCRQSLIEKRTDKHSQKPEKSYQDIELVSHGPYLEMFCRNSRPGWDAWGNEVVSDVEIV
jgi:MT-A70